MELRLAQKQKVKIKVGLSGASGFGKTYSALLMAYGIVSEMYPELKPEQIWNKIAIIDSENDSGSLYSDLGPYYTIGLQPPFSPQRYIEAIQTCSKGGIEVCIIDSITPEWDGKGGCLEIHGKLGGRYQDWAKVTPMHDAFIQEILQTPMHVITTVRRKQDYEMTKDNMGRVQVQKTGMKEITRDGFEYELTLNFELVNDNHMAKASKDRTGIFMNQLEFVITEDTGRTLLKWANSGIEEEQVVVNLINSASNRQELEGITFKYPNIVKIPKVYAELVKMGKLFPKENITEN